MQPEAHSKLFFDAFAAKPSPQEHVGEEDYLAKRG